MFRQAMHDVLGKHDGDARGHDGTVRCGICGEPVVRDERGHWYVAGRFRWATGKLPTREDRFLARLFEVLSGRPEVVGVGVYCDPATPDTVVKVQFKPSAYLDFPVQVMFDEHVAAIDIETQASEPMIMGAFNMNRRGLLWWQLRRMDQFFRECGIEVSSPSQ